MPDPPSVDPAAAELVEQTAGEQNTVRMIPVCGRRGEGQLRPPHGQRDAAVRAAPPTLVRAYGGVRVSPEVRMLHFLCGCSGAGAHDDFVLFVSLQSEIDWHVDTDHDS